MKKDNLNNIFGGNIDHRFTLINDGHQEYYTNDPKEMLETLLFEYDWGNIDEESDDLYDYGRYSMLDAVTKHCYLLEEFPTLIKYLYKLAYGYEEKG